MKTIQNILLTAAALGVVISGLLGILVVLDVASLSEAKDTLVKTAAVIAIVATTAMAVLLIMKATSRAK